MNLKEQKAKIHKDIDFLKRKLSQINEKISQDELSKNFSLLDGIEILPILFENSNRDEMLRVVSAMADNLKAEKELDIEYIPSSIIENELKENQILKLHSRYGSIDLFKGFPSIIGAHPGAGKTTILVNIAWDCIQDKRPCLFFSLELTRSQIYIKLYQIELFYKTGKHYSYSDVIFFYKNKTDFRDAMHAYVNQTKDYLLIIEASGFSSGKICGVYERSIISIGEKPEIVFVDYVQRIHPERETIKMPRREQQISSSQIITEKAKTSQAIFLLASQLNKDGDTMESQAWNQDASLVIRLSREKDESNEGRYKQEVILETKKNRFGEIKFKIIPFADKAGVIGDLKSEIKEPSFNY